MVQAMNTGHDGSMTTVHANSAFEVVERLEVLILMAADLPVTSIHRQLSTALDLIVHISRLPGGRRVVTQISEVARYDPEEKRIVVLDIFNFRNGQSPPADRLPSDVHQFPGGEGSVGVGIPVRTGSPPARPGGPVAASGEPEKH